MDFKKSSNLVVLLTRLRIDPLGRSQTNLMKKLILIIAIEVLHVALLRM